MGLLAVDLGIRTGLAYYGRAGRLEWYRSRNYGSRGRLRRAAYGLLGEVDEVEVLLLEGGGRIAEIWQKEAKKQKIRTHLVDAGVWRDQLLYPSERRTAADAKQNAIAMARRVIEWAEADRPTSLRHDAAEAILAGLWGVLQLGWLAQLPHAVRKR